MEHRPVRLMNSPSNSPNGIHVIHDDDHVSLLNQSLVSQGVYGGIIVDEDGPHSVDILCCCQEFTVHFTVSKIDNWFLLTCGEDFIALRVFDQVLSRGATNSWQHATKSVSV